MKGVSDIHQAGIHDIVLPQKRVTEERGGEEGIREDKDTQNSKPDHLCGAYTGSSSHH